MQIRTILIVAMLCLAMAGISVAQPAYECCWAEPCGTPVEQCDKEPTFVLYEVNDTARIVVTEDDYVYLDMQYDYDEDEEEPIITPNDVRLTGYHDEPANTKVAEGDGDNGAIIDEFYNESMLTYMDINYNNKYDLYDPVYIDLYDKGNVSVGDIRLTDVPPVTPVRMVDGPSILQEGDIVNTSQYAGLDRWEPVTPGDADLDADLDLEVIGMYGAVTELVAWVDADDSGDWNCADKLYINQPNGDRQDMFVTIGDVRLFIPEDDDCVPECGTKVEQGDHDATYMLSFLEDVQLAKSVECNAVYVDMDDSYNVSYGDVRLSAVNKQIDGVTVHYDPNTKVVVSDEADLNDDLMHLSDRSIKYLDIDGLPGYSAFDPVYLDLSDGGWGSWDATVSGGDIRLTASPVVKTGVVEAGAFGEAWSVVDDTFGAEDGDVGMDLDTLPGLGGWGDNLEDVLGYIDSDCTGTWTCSDKLYVQQMVERWSWCNDDDFRTEPFDKFVTVGDLRLYVPQEAIDNEDWPECGAKVLLCNIDVEYALGANVINLISFTDGNYNNTFDGLDAAYVDMDESYTVTDGDVRLTSVTRKNTTYENNTKVVCNTEMEDGDVGLLLEGHYDASWYEGEYTDLLSMLQNATSVKHFDADCSRSWTCVDALFVQYNDGHDPITDEWSPVDNFVTHMDGRLYIPPCDDEPNGECNYHAYDDDPQNGIISIGEVNNAIDDYRAGEIDIGMVNEVIDLYRMGGSYCNGAQV